MLFADADGHVEAMASVVSVIIAAVAVFVGYRAARSANRTFRLEAEPRLVVRCAGETKFVWSRRDKAYQRMKASVGPREIPLDDSYYDELDDAPIYLIDGKPTTKDGLTLRQMTALERMDTTGPRPVWPAIKVEVMNLGRSPAIQVGITWKLSTLVTSIGFTENGEVLAGAEEASGEATIVIDGVSANGSAFIWIGNTIGLQVTLEPKSPCTQREPLDLNSGKTADVSLVATSPFKVGPSDYSV